VQNTVYGNNLFSVAPKGEISISTLGDNLVQDIFVANNIGYATCRVCFSVYIDRQTALRPGIVLSGNLWYSTSKNWYGGVQNGGSLKRWNESMPFVHQDLYWDPKFKNSSAFDYSLTQSSPARSAGTSMPGDPFSAIKPDIGALSYNPPGPLRLHSEEQ
jgi:hypothetical protein